MKNRSFRVSDTNGELLKLLNHLKDITGIPICDIIWLNVKTMTENYKLTLSTKQKIKLSSVAMKHEDNYLKMEARLRYCASNLVQRLFTQRRKLVSPVGSWKMLQTGLKNIREFIPRANGRN